MNFIDPELEAKLQPELFPGEKLLWAGTPKRGIVFRLSDLLVIPFSFVWLYTVITIMEFPSDEPILTIFLSVFLCVGAYMAVGRFFWDSLSRSKTTYGVAQNHIIILSGVFSKSEKTLDINELAKITLSERLDSYGTITFYTEYSWFDRVGLTSRSKPKMPEFDIILNPAEVYKIIMDRRTESDPDA